MRYSLIAIILLSLIGCNGSLPVKCDPVIIKVPVKTPAPIPPEVLRPSLPLTGNAETDADKGKELAATIEALKSYALELEGYLDAYRNKAIENNQNFEKEK